VTARYRTRGSEWSGRLGRRRPPEEDPGHHDDESAPDRDCRPPAVPDGEDGGRDGGEHTGDEEKL
jgi:hypothetical protein